MAYPDLKSGGFRHLLVKDFNEHTLQWRLYVAIFVACDHEDFAFGVIHFLAQQQST